MKRSRLLGWIVLAGVVLLIVGALFVAVGSERSPGRSMDPMALELLGPSEGPRLEPVEGDAVQSRAARRSVDIMAPLTDAPRNLAPSALATAGETSLHGPARLDVAPGTDVPLTSVDPPDEFPLTSASR